MRLLALHLERYGAFTGRSLAFRPDARLHVVLGLNEAGAHAGEPFAAKVLEQANIMRDQVAHHLERARIAARLTAVTTLTDVSPVIDALQRTMEKIHRDRDIEIEASIAGSLQFRGERQDLEEMVGNLIDNACKWARSKVHIDVRAQAAAADGSQPMIRIVVDDDGPGLTSEERAQVARRGQRLDESKPGSGLGLAISRSLAELHGGALKIRSTEGAGTIVSVRIPVKEKAILAKAA